MKVKGIEHCSLNFDPLSPVQLEDPYPIYARLRAEEPIHYEEKFDLWIISRHEDVEAVAMDPSTFSSQNAVRSSIAVPAPEVKAELDKGYPPTGTLTDSDEPRHRRLRSLVNKVFTLRRVAEMEPKIHRRAHELIDRFVNNRRAELISAFAWPLPLNVIADMLGIPEADLPQIHEWTVDWLRLIQATDPVNQQIKYARSFVSLQQYSMQLCECRTREPKNDLTTALLGARLEGEQPLSLEEAMWVPLNLVMAGHVTVTRAISNSIVLLFNNPDQRDLLLKDPSLMERAVEETLRLESPAQGLFRTATRDTSIGGVRIPKGARLMLLYGSANRDEEKFDRPSEMDFQRSDLGQHLAFGKGIHFCLGASLARLETQIALDALLRRLPNLRPDPDRRPERDTIFFARGWLRLPVVWGNGG